MRPIPLVTLGGLSWGSDPVGAKQKNALQLPTGLSGPWANLANKLPTVVGPAAQFLWGNERLMQVEKPFR